MAGKKIEVENVVVPKLRLDTVMVHIVGDSDLILNKKTDSTFRELTAADRKLAHKQEESERNEWEDAITALHWRDPRPYSDKAECTEEMFYRMLQDNAPCISAHGLRESWKSCVVRAGIDTYSTKFDFQVSIRQKLIPIKFAAYQRDILAMPQKGIGGGMLTAKLHRFSGWEADIPVTYIKGGTYSLSAIVSIIEYAGYGLGIGSGTKSEYGRYHVEDVK